MGNKSNTTSNQDIIHQNISKREKISKAAIQTNRSHDKKMTQIQLKKTTHQSEPIQQIMKNQNTQCFGHSIPYRQVVQKINKNTIQQNYKYNSEQNKEQQTNHDQYLQFFQLNSFTGEKDKDFDKLRKAFALKLRKFSQQKYQNDNEAFRKRQRRVEILLAFHHLSNYIYKTTYNSQQGKLLQNIYKGNTDQVREMIKNNPNLLLFKTKGNKYPLLYIASMTGHVDMVEMIIKTGPNLNFISDRSTPMHAATFYNHYHVGKLLLDYGIPHDIKNIHGQIPILDAQGQLYDLIAKADKNKFTQLINPLIQKKLCKTVVNIQQQKNRIVRKILLSNYDQDFTDYVDAYHGTRLQNMQSIAENGLRKPGTKIGERIIEVEKGNIPQGIEFNGDKDWAKKIYVSPSIHYALKYSATEYFYDEDQRKEKVWKPVVQVKVRKGCYKQFGDTTNDHQRVNNEPQNLQYQIEDEKDVKVVALLLVKRNWIGQYYHEKKRDYNETSVILLQNQEEKYIKKLKPSFILQEDQN